jgi:general L-amino acid transport system permease protein
VTVLVGLSISNLVQNLDTRNLKLGFDFLDQQAGFEIGFSILPFSATSTFWDVFVIGLANTLLVTVIGVVAATILGVSVGLARVSANRALSNAALIYVEVFRNLPLLMQILLWYNVVLRALPAPRNAFAFWDILYLSNRGLYFPWLSFSPAFSWWPWIAAILLLACLLAVVGYIISKSALAAMALGLGAAVIGSSALAAIRPGAIGVTIPQLDGFDFSGGFVVRPELAALVVALSVYNGAFIAELVRGAIEAVGRGQKEAALALGLSRRLAFKLVVFPQCLRILVPPLINQHLNLLKASSLAIAVGYPDLVNVFVGTALNQTGRALEIVSLTMMTYLAIGMVISMIGARVNASTRIVER